MTFLNDLTMQVLLSHIAGFLLFTAIHGGLIAAIATLLRIDGPDYRERLTLNPFIHLSLPGLAMAVLFRSGWVRSLPVDHTRLRGGRAGLLVIVVGALAISLAIVPLVDLLRPIVAAELPRTAGYAVLRVIVAFQEVSLGSIALNLLPLPGLTAGLLLQALMPEQTGRLRRLETPVIVLLVIALVAGWLPDPLPFMQALVGTI